MFIDARIALLKECPVLEIRYKFFNVPQFRQIMFFYWYSISIIRLTFQASIAIIGTLATKRCLVYLSKVIRTLVKKASNGEEQNFICRRLLYDSNCKSWYKFLSFFRNNSWENLQYLASGLNKNMPKLNNDTGEMIFVKIALAMAGNKRVLAAKILRQVD